MSTTTVCLADFMAAGRFEIPVGFLSGSQVKHKILTKIGVEPATEEASFTRHDIAYTRIVETAVPD